MPNLQGQLVFIVIAAYLLAAVITIPARAILRRSVHKLMMRAVPLPDVPPRDLRANATPLRVEITPARDVAVSADATSLLASLRRSRVQAALVSLLAGSVAAAIFAYGFLSEEGGGTMTQFVVVFTAYLWPVAITVFAVAARTRIVRVIGLIVCALLIVGVTAGVSGSVVLFGLSAFPTLAVLLILWLSRALAPLVALFGAIAVMGLVLATSVFGRSNPSLACSIAILVVVAGVACAWVFVALLVGAFERKWFGDLSFELGFLWATFAIWYMLVRGSTATWWYGLVALAAYTAITQIAWRVLRLGTSVNAGANLLVLRVFDSKARGRRVFAALGRMWDPVGPLHLIAGTDSAAANLDLAEAWRFLRMKIKSLYVRSKDDLDQRMAALDVKPDADGRYRTNDFFCYAHTWKPTFTRLLDRSYAVLVDLGGFTKQ
ncbi:MAG TPA: hypothetical protein VF608_14390, partial [Thermoanaerobaculia bacterium]